MFKLIADLFATKKINFKEGQILLVDESVSIVPLDYIVTNQKNLEKIQKDRYIYYSAKDMGVRWFKNMYNHFNISYEEVIRWGINILSVAGWGKTEVPKFNSTKEFYSVKLLDAAEAIAYGKSDHPVDFFIRGCYASGAKVLFGKECDAIETKCISIGDKYCEFIAQPRDKFDFTDPFVKRQLGDKNQKLRNS